jgi:hypothetical protein
MSVYFSLFAGWLAGLTLFGPAAPVWAASAPANRGNMPLAASDRPLGDGSVNAPNCKIPHPSLLQAYRVRPPWRVAGVDYCVGYPMSKTLKDPATLSMAGVTVDDVHKLITVTRNGAVLDGYDFSRDGGWGVSVKAKNVSILNSRFVVGSNANPPIRGTEEAANLTVAYTLVDGAGIDVGNFGLIQMKGQGLTVRYCWIANSAGDSIQSHNGGILDLQYNLIEQGGLAPGAHGDFLEVFAGPFQAKILYNTTYQHNGGSGGNQGLMLEPDFQDKPGVIASAEYGHNTLIATGGHENYLIGITASDIVGIVNVHDNFFDTTGTYGFVRGGPNTATPNDLNSKTVFTHNVNMRTRVVIQDSRRPAMLRPRSPR